MKSTFSLCCAALLLLAGCRSQQAAFRFEPAAASSSVAGAQAAESAAAAVVASSAHSSTPMQQEPTTRPAAVRHQAPARRLLPASVRLVRPVHRPAASTASAATSPYHKHQRQPRQTQLEHTAAFVLGAALIAGGVVGGILLGGWLGLGVGALVVLLGYYFVGVGIGGKHAWLEVFQEFFNM